MPLKIIRPKRTSRAHSIGWFAAAWMEHFLVHGAGDVVGMDVELIDDQVEFLVDLYALAPPGEDDEGRRLVDEALLLLPKGSDKSGFAARVLIFEAIGPCRFDQWATGGEIYRDPWGMGFEYVFEPGEPMGRPVQNPFIRCLATSEDQSSNTYESILYNFKEGRLARVLNRSDDAGLTRINIPGGGKIEPSTAADSSKDGGRESAANADEVHLYRLTGQKNMYRVVMRNLRKRAKTAEPFMFSTSTWFNPTEESICQDLWEKAKLQDQGKTKNDRLLVHYRYGEIEPEDLGDSEKLKKALVESYGGATLWMDLDALVNEVQDVKTPLEDSYRYFLNSPSWAVASWIAPFEIRACGPDAFNSEDPTDPDTYFPEPDPVRPGDVITLGFDGSRKRTRGVTDSTALVAVRVRDGVAFPIQIWEQPPGYHGKDGWEAPVADVEERIKWAFRTYRVVGFYCDPAHWESLVSSWEARWGPSLKVKASASSPCSWWMGAVPKRTVKAIDDLEHAILNRELKHFGDPVLVSHIINCRRKESTAGRQLAKETPNSPRKIDGAVALILAWQARLDAVSKGLATTKKRTAYRLR